jgi:hypothetical protein
MYRTTWIKKIFISCCSFILLSAFPFFAFAQNLGVIGVPIVQGTRLHSAMSQVQMIQSAITLSAPELKSVLPAPSVTIKPIIIPRPETVAGVAVPAVLTRQEAVKALIKLEMESVQPVYLKNYVLK